MSSDYLSNLRTRQKEDQNSPAAAFELAMCLWQVDVKESMEYFLLAATVEPTDDLWKEDALCRLTVQFDQSFDMLIQMRAFSYSQAGLLLRQLSTDKVTLLENIEQIVCYYQESLRLNPKRACLIYGQLVLWFIDCERWMEAEQACANLFSVLPEDALDSGNYHNYALVLYKQNLYSRAVPYAVEGIRKNPNETACWNLLIQIYKAAGNDNEAERISELLEKRGKGYRKHASEIEVP